jgi:hypothetical protein
MPKILVTPKTRGVQFAAGGRPIALTFPLMMLKTSAAPIHRKTRVVHFASGGRQIALTFPLIVESPMPKILVTHRQHRKTRGVQVAADGRQIPPTFEIIVFKFESKFELPPQQVHLGNNSRKRFLCMV